MFGTQYKIEMAKFKCFESANHLETYLNIPTYIDSPPKLYKTKLI